MQPVTLAASGRKVDGDVSPHLVIELRKNGLQRWRAFLAEGRKRMDPLYRWAVEMAEANLSTTSRAGDRAEAPRPRRTRSGV